MFKYQAFCKEHNKLTEYEPCGMSMCEEIGHYVCDDCEKLERNNFRFPKLIMGNADDREGIKFIEHL